MWMATYVEEDGASMIPLNGSLCGQGEVRVGTQMWTATYVEEDGASMIPLNGSLCGQGEDRVGTPSESSHIATGPLKRKLLFQLFQ